MKKDNHSVSWIRICAIMTTILDTLRTQSAAAGLPSFQAEVTRSSRLPLKRAAPEHYQSQSKSEQPNSTTQQSAANGTLGVEEARDNWVLATLERCLQKTEDEKNLNILMKQITDNTKLVTEHVKQNNPITFPKYAIENPNAARVSSELALSQSQALSRWCSALKKCTSKLLKAEDKLALKRTLPMTTSDTGTGTIMNLLLSFDWRGHTIHTLEIYTSLLIKIVTNRNILLRRVFRVLCKQFLANNVIVDTTLSNANETRNTPLAKPVSLEQSDFAMNSSDDLDAVPAKTGLSEDTTNAIATLDDIHNLVHRSLQRIIILAPNSISLLFSVLIDRYPHWSRDELSLQLYLKNLLRISEYLPSLRDTLLTAIVERLIQLDVEIIEVSHIAQLSEQELELNKANTEKLDSQMSLLFQYLHLIQSSSAEHEQLSDEVFGSLMRVFKNNILLTHKSRFTQFLVFYFSSVKHIYAETFVQWLLELSRNEQSAEIIRTSCASYFASFVARSSFIRQATSLLAFESLIQWLHGYVEKSTATDDISLSNNRPFYYLCQAAFYILCFRLDIFQQQAELTNGSLSKYMQRYDLKRLVNSKFLPLRFCNINIAKEFMHVVKSLGLFKYDYLSTAELDNSRNHSDFQLEDSYPFDPYRLKHSYAYIAPLYRGQAASEILLGKPDKQDVSELDHVAIPRFSMLSKTDYATFSSETQTVHDVLLTTVYDSEKDVATHCHKNVLDKTHSLLAVPAGTIEVTESLASVSFEPQSHSPYTTSPLAISTPLMGSMQRAVSPLIRENLCAPRRVDAEDDDDEE